MKNILIFGSGSIGNHMSYASSKLGHKVFITDINNKALERMKKNIYPKRYGKWNKKILQVKYQDLKKINKVFDLIIIGTPPKNHIEMIKYCQKNLNYKKILIEKPLCVYNQNYNFLKIKDKRLFAGYNHSISPSIKYFFKEIDKLNDKFLSVEVLWKEGWTGILGAHFWMKNEFDSYLGNIKSGGGALHEHSHGLHLLILILKKLKIRYSKLNFNKKIYYKKKFSKKYDIFSHFSSKLNNILIKYETDLLTFPSQKEIIINCKNLSLRWICNYKKGIDVVIKNNMKTFIKKEFKKTRSSEFENEIKNILNLKENYNNSNLNIQNSIQVMDLIKKIIK